MKRISLVALLLSAALLQTAQARCDLPANASQVYGYEWNGARCTTLEEIEALIRAGNGSFPTMQLAFTMPTPFDQSGNVGSVLDYRPFGALGTSAGVLVGPPAATTSRYRAYVRGWPPASPLAECAIAGCTSAGCPTPELERQRMECQIDRTWALDPRYCYTRVGAVAASGTVTRLARVDGAGSANGVLRYGPSSSTAVDSSGAKFTVTGQTCAASREDGAAAEAKATQQFIWAMSRDDSISCGAGTEVRGGATSAADACGADFAKLLVSSPKFTQTPNQCGIGNPCFPGSGNKSAQVDLFAYGRIAMTLNYGSLRQLRNYGYLDGNWSHSYARRILTEWGQPSHLGANPEISPIASVTVMYVQDDAPTLETYRRDGSLPVGTFRSTSSHGRTLRYRAGSQIDPPSYELTYDDGTVDLYDRAGRLTNVRHADDPAADLTLGYGGDPIDEPPATEIAHQQEAFWRIDRITDAGGRYVRFEYADPRLQRLRRIVADDGTTELARLDYDAAGRLSAVARFGRQRTFAYNEPAYLDVAAGVGGAWLTGMFDEDGRREATYAYDDWGRVKASWHGRDAGKVEVAYPVRPDGTQDDSRAIVTPPVGLPVEYQFDMSHPYRQVSRIVDAVGTVQLTYHPTLHRLAARVDARNVRTEYEYDGDGSRETARTEAVGTPQQRRIETPWNAANGRPEAKRIYADAPGGPRTLLRDVRYRYVPGTARLAGVDKVDPADGRSRSTGYTYCSAADVATPANECGLEGQLRSIDGPRTDVADVTSYAYYVADNLAGCGTQAGPCQHRGDLKRVTNALGHRYEVLAYDRAGRPVRVRDPNGTLIDYAYHARGWLTSRTLRANAAGTPDAADATTTFEHDGSGNVTRVNFPDGGNALVYAYDDAHRLESITDATGNILSFTLDSAGNRVNEHRSSTTSDMWWNISREYDILNRLIYELDAVSRPTLRMELNDPVAGVRNGYDANGNPRRSIDVRGTQTDHQYDALNRLVTTLHDFGGSGPSANARTQYGYDARGHLVSVLDADDVATGYSYDGLDDLRSETGADAGNRSYEYDLGGNRIRATDARPMTVTHVFDALNRRVGTYTPSGLSDVVRDYDLTDKQTQCTGSFAKGRLSRITDSSGTATYCYDRRGNVVRKMLLPPGAVWLDGTGREIGYAYDRNDRVRETTYPSGAVVSYTRDAGGHVVTIARREHATAPPVTLVAATRFYPFGPLNSVSFGNGRTLTKTYDTNYTPDTLESTLPGGLVLDFDVDGARNVVAVGATIDGPPQRRYRYDPLGRLDRVQDSSNAIVEEYTYSRGGDRTGKRIGAQPLQSYGYAPGSHRLANVGSWVRQYDATGNTTRLPPATNYPLAYDDLGRLSKVTLDGQGAPVDTRYTYNALGQRVGKTTANETVVTDYDEAGNRIVDAAWRTECPDGGSSVRGAPTPPAPSAAYCPDGSLVVLRFLWRTEYVYLEGMPVAIVRYVGNGAAQLSYLETDHLGTPRVAVDAASGAVQWRWDLVSSAFGEHAPNTTAGFELNLRYPGQYYDRETGMHYNGFRDYDPATGRYLQSDPIGLAGGPNRYAYVGSSALNATDPAGLVKVDLFGPAEKEQIYHDAVATYIDKPDECLVYSHGTSQSVFDGRSGRRLTTAEQLQQALLDGGCRKGMKVTLFSCNTGAGPESIGKTLAEGEDGIFTDVTAPTKTIWYNRADGISGPTMIFGKDPEGEMNTNDPGEFVNFRQ